MKLLVALGLTLLVGCTPGQTADTGHASGTPRPTATPPSRIAVLGGVYGSTSTLTIADLTGHPVARATFASMPRPLVTNAGDVMPASVRLAAGAAFYAEPTGKVHRLDPTGTDAVVATFPMTTTQQELSFAVSPDGKQLVAMVLTAPPVHDPPPSDISQPFFRPGTRWSEELELAPAGGATRSLTKTDLGPSDHPVQSVTTIAGWDDQGPVALIDTILAAQSALASRQMPGSALVHLGLDGAPHDRIGGSDCHPLGELHDGTTLCYTGAYPTAYEVRTADGQPIWRQDLAGAFYYDPVLSPGGRRIAVENTLFTESVSPASVARQLDPQPPVQVVGWVNAGTLAISASGGSVQLADVTDLAHPRDTGLTGAFIGTL
jgi:hypothetical protein